MRFNKQIITYLVFIIPTLMLGQIQNNFSGYFDNYMISGLSDGKIIKIPFRMINLNIQNSLNDFTLTSNLAMEIQLKSDPFSEKFDADISWDIRELYFTWFHSLGELRFGKQIHTWGMVDENSPLDVVSAFDYYYLFFQGSERKIGANSIAFDFYLNNWKFGGVFSPFHQTNRLPGNDGDFPIKMPVVPEPLQMIEINEASVEFGGFIERPFDWGDVRLSYFQGFDRVNNFSGVNVFTINENDLSFFEYDIAYGFRKTRVLGLGTVLFIEDLVLRGDLGFFQTKDLNKTIKTESTIEGYPFHGDEFPTKEASDYYQFTFQFEYGLPFDISIGGQYFNYDIIHYESDEIPIKKCIKMTNFEICPEDVNPRNFFNPGMGTPLAVLTKQAVIITLEKTFLDDQLNFNLLSLLDIAKPKETNKTKIWGAMFGFTMEYNVTQNLHGVLGITKILGKNTHPDGELYRFNAMEDFSHIRMELKYFF
ncbi:MAG: hypothetical protein QF814_09950 [Candidatus Marinimicrobia bacterium]|nr:hypothetical protein [Candidatus Neomarinimicrobiota bacterium]